MSIKQQKEILGEPDSQFDASLFVTKGNLTSVCDRGSEQLYLTRQDSGLQSRNRKLIQQILKNFDMEKSKRHYETLNVVEYTLDPNNFSYDSSLSTIRVRQRLQGLMGSDVIRLNDRRYFEKLSTKLRHEYETALDRKEHAREEAERERLRKLVLAGVIEDKSENQSDFFKDKQKRKGKKKRKKSKKKTYQPNDDDDAAKDLSIHSEDWNTTKTSGFSEVDYEEEEEEEDILTQIQIESGSRPSSSTSRRPLSSRQGSSQGSRPSSSTSRRPQSSRQRSFSPTHRSASPGDQHSVTSSRTPEMTHIPPPHHEDASRKSFRSKKRVQSAMPRISTVKKSEETDSDEEIREETKSLPGDLAQTERQRRLRRFSIVDPPLIRELKKEETVSGLYSIADKLIFPVATKEEDERLYREFAKERARAVSTKQKKMK